MNQQNGFWLKQPLLLQTGTNGFCPDSPKGWFFECEATLHKKYKIFEDTKAENGNYDRLESKMLDQFRSIRWAPKPKRFQGY